jgi:hypothetical protein
MLIQVLRTGNRYDYVKDYMLDGLIESKGIIQFRRRTGWVNIDEGPLRKDKRNDLFNNTGRIETNGTMR